MRRKNRLHEWWGKEGTNNFFLFIFLTNTPKNHAILPALNEILGHKSAHPFAAGPVIAEPFILPLLFIMTLA